uniref:Uncharacterized protein n=1 Tax=Bacillus glycinifermentans TaxID=1664069 RepID=A0A2I7ZJK3_9BACI|nr:hypothetical protein [Bacillus glycinifermentans]
MLVSSESFKEEDKRKLAALRPAFSRFSRPGMPRGGRQLRNTLASSRRSMRTHETFTVRLQKRTAEDERELMSLEDRRLFCDQERLRGRQLQEIHR